MEIKYNYFSILPRKEEFSIFGHICMKITISSLSEQYYGLKLETSPCHVFKQLPNRSPIIVSHSTLHFYWFNAKIKKNQLSLPQCTLVFYKQRLFFPKKTLYTASNLELKIGFLYYMLPMPWQKNVFNTKQGKWILYVLQ